MTHAKVQLRNEATNVTNAGAVASEGDYVFADVKPGLYELTFNAPGFSEQKLSHIVLEVSQTVRHDVTLAVGSVSSSVQVKSEHVLVQTDTTSIGGVIESAQIENMPLNGRTTTFGLLALSPGVQGAGADPKISGSSWIGTNGTMDGMTDMEMENTRLSAAEPSLESLSEFRVIDSTGSAEYGSGAAQVIVSTKSGTNAYHGSLFEYNRNVALSAKNFFSTGLPKPPYNRNEFGGSLGGPMKRNKLFFFFGSYEGLLFRSSATKQTAQPTPGLRQGNFAGLGGIKDPFTGAPFPANQIPAGRISPIAQKLFSYFPTPNLVTSAAGGLGTNYIAVLPSQQSNYRYEGRLDYAINSANSVFARYFYADTYNLSAGTTPFTGADLQPFTNQNLSVNYTHIFSPRVVNVATFGLLHEVDQFLSQNHNLEPGSLIPGITKVYPGLGGVPSVSITGFTGLSDALGSGDTIPAYQFADTLTWVTGKHTFKAGFSFLRYQFLTYGNQTPEYGALAFNGQYTGNAFADFLLGYAASSTEQLAPYAVQPRNERYGFFFQDDWKIFDRLTMNIGLRYDLPTLFVNTVGGMANWYPKLNSLVVIKGQYDPTAYPSLPIVSGQSVGLNTSNYIGNDLHQVAPRFGLAWRPLGTSRLVVRSGYGMYYEAMPWKFGTYSTDLNPPFNGTISFEPNAGAVPSLLLNNAFPTGSGTVPSGIGINAYPAKYRYPMTHQWNLTLESQVTAATVLRATYLGAEREHSGSLYPINDPPPSPGPVQPNRPYQPFGSITLLDNGLTANTQQLQLSAQRRFSSGLSFGAEYAFTKELDGSLSDRSLPTVPSNQRLDHGNDPQIRRQYMVGNYVYELPFGAGKRYLSSLHGVLNVLLGGWKTSGIVTLASGLPFSVPFTSSVQGWPSSRANIVGNPGVSNPGLLQWFNPAAFAVPAPYTFGNSAPNSLFGPGYRHWDTSAFKNFRFGERWKLQFRSEFFNALNHPTFSNPNANISTPSLVGKITSTSNSPRVIQFALRLEF